MEDGERALRKLIAALSELEHCAHWEEVNMSVDAEVQKFGMGSKRTGRSTLTITLPYTRDRRFLERQLSMLAEQMESLESMKSTMTDEYTSLQEEINSLD